MYSLVIAEDEFTTRRGLVNMIRWKELGFRVDGEFSDGQDLLDYLKSHTPDVILTDIRMTRVDGIEIARFVAKQNLPIQVVFLSGHKEFAFAQEAVEYHVYHYLLKPVDLSMLREVFRSLKEKLDQMSRREELIQSRLDHYQSLVNHERQQFVTDAYFGSLTSPEQIAKRLGLIGSAEWTDHDGQEGGNPHLFLVKMVLVQDGQYRDFLDSYGRWEMQEQLVHAMECFDPGLEYYPITWNGTGAEEMSVLGVFWEKEPTRREEFAPEELMDTIYSLLAIRVRIETFLCLKSPEELTCCVRDVGKEESADHLMEDEEYLQLLQDQNKLLCSYLCQNDFEQALELAGTLCDSYLRGGEAFARRYCIYTAMKLLEEAACRDLTEWNRLYGVCMDPLPPARPDEMKGWLADCVAAVFAHMGRQADGRQDTSIGKVMGYLKEHYSEDITLNGIAEAVFLNPVYISRLIKEQTGKNYTDLVMEMRIERAVELLGSSDLYVYEVAEKVGYNNLKYFYKVFRKVKGKSPSDYRTGTRER